MKKIFIISGKARNGKDSTYEIMKKHLEFYNEKCLRIAYGDYVKFIAKQYLGWNGIKDEKGRETLQELGTERVRKGLNKPDYWVDRVIDTIKIVGNEYKYIFITDARFPNEIELIKQAFPNMVQTIRVSRKDFISPLTEEQQKHISETALDDYKFDYYIESENGLNNLETKILDTFKFIKPMKNHEIGDSIKIRQINDMKKAKHLIDYIGQVGSIYSYIKFNDGTIKYKVLFNDNETAYFFGNELEEIK
ncbi:nucleoside/nucleotide kinase family protein [Clostridium sp. CTA-6]